MAIIDQCGYHRTTLQRVALVHDWLNQLGGAEDVLVALKRLFPDAPVFTSIYDRARMPDAWRAWDIRPNWMDRLPGIHRHHQPYMPLYALAFGASRVPADFDVILSNKSAFCFAMGAANPAARRICYCLTPTRFIYDFDAYAARETIPAMALPALRLANAVLRRFERAAAQRIDTFIAISSEVQRRIQSLYGRESVVIYPPVDVARFTPDPSAATGDYFFIASRLLPYKRIELAIQACNRLGKQLVIAGDGRDRPRLERLAAQGDNVTFLGRVSDERLLELLRGCRAFIFPGLEDFGIAPINAMACGRPVIAFAGGGALDTVQDGETGIMFLEQTVESLADALVRFDGVRFAPGHLRKHAESFSVERFEAELLSVIDRPA